MRIGVNPKKDTLPSTDRQAAFSSHLMPIKVPLPV